MAVAVHTVALSDGLVVRKHAMLLTEDGDGAVWRPCFGDTTFKATLEETLTGNNEFTDKSDLGGVMVGGGGGGRGGGGGGGELRAVRTNDANELDNC